MHLSFCRSEGRSLLSLESKLRNSRTPSLLNCRGQQKLHYIILWPISIHKKTALHHIQLNNFYLRERESLTEKMKTVFFWTSTKLVLIRILRQPVKLVSSTTHFEGPSNMATTNEHWFYCSGDNFYCLHTVLSLFTYCSSL